MCLLLDCICELRDPCKRLKSNGVLLKFEPLHTTQFQTLKRGTQKSDCSFRRWNKNKEKSKEGLVSILLALYTSGNCMRPFSPGVQHKTFAIWCIILVLEPTGVPY